MADPWAEFDGTPAATPGVMGARGGTAGPLDPWAAFDGAPAPAPTSDVPTAGAPVVHPGQRTGLIANTGAALQEGGAGLVNIASDPFGHLIGKPLVALGTGAYNLGARAFGYQPLSSEKMDLLLNDGPGPGDRMVAGLNAAGGAPNPSDVVPGTAAERYLRAGVGGAIGMAALGPVGGVRAATGTLATGVLSGVGSQAAQDVLPADLAPAGSVLGGIAVPMAPALAGAGVRAVTRPVTKALADYAAPMMGKPSPLLDAAGQAFTSPDNTLLTATPNQIRLAGQGLASSTTDLPAARAAAGNVVENVPGENPTTFQATRDPKLGTLEAEAKNGAGKDLFLAREAQQNDARVAQLRTLPGDANKSALTAEAVRQADAVDTRTAADVQTAQTMAARGVDATTAAGEASTAAQTTVAQQAGDRLGGNLPAGSDATVGAALRAPVADAYQAVRAQESALWNAIDPNRTLAVDMTPIRTKANEIAGSIGPNAAKLTGDEAAIMQTAQSLPNVQSFSDLADLRTRLTDTIRAARSDPNRAPEVRRLSQLLDGVHTAMEGSVAPKPDVSASAAAVASDSVAQDVASARQAWKAEQNAAEQTGLRQGNDGGVGSSATARAGRVSTAFNGEVTQGGQLGNAASYKGVQGQPPLEANFNAEAATRYSDARQATSDRVATYKNAPGVGPTMQGGAQSGTFRMSDAAVPNIIVKTGATGADTARAYLAAGGSPQALADAAAFSLRQAAMGPDGLLNISNAASWAKNRQSFLSQTPELRQAIQSAVDARAALDAGRTGAAAALKEATANAETMISNAMTTRTAALKDMQKSALGQYLPGNEPSARLGQMLSDKVHGAAQVQQLFDAIKGNSDALGGARAAALEWVERELIGDGKTANGAEFGIKSATFQAFLRKSGPALDIIMSPEQMQGMRSVAASLERSSLKATAGVGSQTGQVISGRWNKLVNVIGDHVLPTSGASLGGAVGSLAGGWGIAPGIAVGTVAGKIMQSMREAGLTKIENLKMQAMLNPALFHMLTTPVTSKNASSLSAGLAAQLRRVAIVSGAQNEHRQNRP